MELNNTSWKANIMCLLFNIYANYLEISVSCYKELWWVRLNDFHSYKCVYCFNTFLSVNMWIREYGLKMNHKYSDVVREKNWRQFVMTCLIRQWKQIQWWISKENWINIQEQIFDGLRSMEVGWIEFPRVRWDRQPHAFYFASCLSM